MDIFSRFQFASAMSAKLFGLAVAAGAVAMTALLRGRPIPECNARQRTA